MRRSGGQATVELVLVLPVVVLLLLLVVQVGLIARAQVLVVHAAREGARAAAVEGSQHAAASASRSAPGLRSSRVAVEAAIDASPGGLARVEVTYRAPTDVPLVGVLLGDPVLRAEVTMLVEGPAAGP